MATLAAITARHHNSHARLERFGRGDIHCNGDRATTTPATAWPAGFAICSGSAIAAACTGRFGCNTGSSRGATHSLDAVRARLSTAHDSQRLIRGSAYRVDAAAPHIHSDERGIWIIRRRQRRYCNVHIGPWNTVSTSGQLRTRSAKNKPALAMINRF